jgi:hypothetical protein
MMPTLAVGSRDTVQRLRVPFTERGIWFPGNSTGRAFLRFLGKHAALLLSSLSLVISILSYLVSVTSVRLAQRAYVFHAAELTNSEELTSSMQKRDVELHVTIKFTAKNLGNTPASNVDYRFAFSIPADSEMHIGGDRPLRAKVDLGPKDAQSQTLLYRFKQLSGKPFDNPFSNGLTGTLDYYDVFGKPHSVTICYVLYATDHGSLLSPCDQQEQEQGKPAPNLPVVPQSGKLTFDKQGHISKDK